MDLLTRFKTIADEFKDEDESFLLNHLAIASESISTAITSPLRDKIIVYLAAHNVDQALKRKGASGQVTSVREAGLAITYSTSTARSEYDFSSYGRTYQQLVKQLIVAPRTRMSLNERPRLWI
jgi:hypothetical protein